MVDTLPEAEKVQKIQKCTIIRIMAG